MMTLYDHLVAACPRDAGSFAAFRSLGFPTIREEDWRFTNLAPYLKDDYRLVVPSPDVSLVRELLRSCAVDGWDAARIVFVNRILQESLSDVPSTGSLSDVLVDTSTYRLAGLNAALSQGVGFRMARANKPIHLIHLYTTDVPAFFQPRVRFVLPSLAELTLLESSLCATGVAPVMINALLECVLEEGARLTHYVLQSGRKGERLLSHTQVVQARDSVYDNVTLNLPEADLIRNQLNVTLDGTGCECHLYGLYLPADHQLIDNHTVVDHRQPNCESNELYKGVLRGNARAVFNGKIFVRREAQKTNAFQKNNNLLLGDKAMVHSKPQLEIFADDVKCSHGSTIGQFNPDSLFYLRARGIGEEMAKELLVQAFGADITERVSSAAVQRHLEKHLHRERPIIHRYDVPKHVEHI
jgi:Fe-S cluster assembly protein SufD